MSDDNYMERKYITTTKTKKDEGKLKRFVINPIKKLGGIEDKKRDRVTA